MPNKSKKVDHQQRKSNQIHDMLPCFMLFYWQTENTKSIDVSPFKRSPASSFITKSLNSRDFNYQESNILRILDTLVIINLPGHQGSLKFFALSLWFAFLIEVLETFKCFFFYNLLLVGAVKQLLQLNMENHTWAWISTYICFAVLSIFMSFKWIILSFSLFSFILIFFPF